MCHLISSSSELPHKIQARIDTTKPKLQKNIASRLPANADSISDVVLMATRIAQNVFLDLIT